jgi:protein-S-isoprenylcysteine O-methyltransferase Ste14
MRPGSVTPPTLLFASIAAMVGLHFAVPVAQVVPSPWRYLGGVPIAFGAVWNVWADQLFQRHKTTVKPHLPPSSLITSGPFRFGRNPMYVGMVAIVFGVAALLGSATPMAVVVGFTVVLAVRYVPMEEDAMAEAFGGAWREYAARVRRWL